MVTRVAVADLKWNDPKTWLVKIAREEKEFRWRPDGRRDVWRNEGRGQTEIKRRHWTCWI